MKRELAKGKVSIREGPDKSRCTTRTLQDKALWTKRTADPMNSRYQAKSLLNSPQEASPVHRAKIQRQPFPNLSRNNGSF